MSLTLKTNNKADIAIIGWNTKDICVVYKEGWGDLPDVYPGMAVDYNYDYRVCNTYDVGPPVNDSVGTCAAFQASAYSLQLNATSLEVKGDAVVEIPEDTLMYDLLVSGVQLINHYQRNATQRGWSLEDRLPLYPYAQMPNTEPLILQSFQNPQQLQAIVEASVHEQITFLFYSFTPASREKPDVFPIPIDRDLLQKVNGSPAFTQTNDGLFHLLIPVFDQDKHFPEILHFISPEASPHDPWQHKATLKVPFPGPARSIALTQADREGSLFAVAWASQSHDNILFGFQSDPAFQWSDGEELVRDVAGSPALFHSVFGDQQYYELLVPGINGVITHYRKPVEKGTKIGDGWRVEAELPPFDGQLRPVSVSLFQASSGKMEAIAHVVTPGGKGLLTSYTFTPRGGWGAPSPVNDTNDHPIIVA